MVFVQTVARVISWHGVGVFFHFGEKLHKFSLLGHGFRVRTNKKWGEIDLRHYVDNGKWDEKIKALGLKKYDKYDMKRILEPLGIEILCRSSDGYL